MGPPAPIFDISMPMMASNSPTAYGRSGSQMRKSRKSAVWRGEIFSCENLEVEGRVRWDDANSDVHTAHTQVSLSIPLNAMSTKHLFNSADGLVLRSLRGAVAANPSLKL